ncbi:multidrug ABC transporter ATP-binding protein [Listeria ivanovii]|uniref:ATP-binding cassette domain-containing protein n=2 Tax=Listeria ivanovii TaxID=1638 RepID=UPI000DAAA7E5|nr:ATP-binding cassette domain-containing protein [Listeria ivanovii]PZF88712.1 multidrug ABC transporter ATP-binding protein [Listeria ivanovii]PZF93936.1 multidrug ABC transporter ATP-binding protein [Listeria ivanovii]PZG04689.1 multidrug ABC transporter ATP-binding protein [Listeria ivanovii]PZG09093.1 multidrug ABC transporter ATP-binding protein [Listeria ivanovii]PZG26038.1 multidrug ABC transporter ATP-binding protein [Listeria ivanovii]
MREIKLKAVSKTLKKREVIRDVTITMGGNNVYGFQGVNGSGKTVLFKLILGFLKPTIGEIFIDGEKMHDKIEFASDTGFIIEYPGFIKYYSGFENLKLLAAIQNKITDKTIYEAIAKVGLNPNNKNKVKDYSLGMRQRLGIAQSFMENPTIIILDEPTNALDTDGINMLKNLIAEWRTQGKLVLLTSHNEAFLKEVCDNLYIIENGGIMEVHTI